MIIEILGTGCPKCQATKSNAKKELLELERIVTDRDEKEALGFLKKTVYNKITRSQQGRLKSHLDAGGNTIENFRRGQ